LTPPAPSAGIRALSTVICTANGDRVGDVVAELQASNRSAPVGAGLVAGEADQVAKCDVHVD
jgi:hypothetical protein